MPFTATCAKCLEFKYSECLVQRHVGVAKAVKVLRKKRCESPGVTQAFALPYANLSLKIKPLRPALCFKPRRFVY